MPIKCIHTKLKLNGVSFFSRLFTDNLLSASQSFLEVQLYVSRFCFNPCLLVFISDKFGSAMALVKSDIGGNISVRSSRIILDISKFLNHLKDPFCYFCMLHLLFVCVYIYVKSYHENSKLSYLPR